MDSDCIKNGTNIYFACRKQAAAFNPAVHSRESASEQLGISVSTLANYELGITTPPVDIVVKMADLYNAPEILNHYCKTYCPIGRSMAIATDVKSLESATLRVLKRLDENDIRHIRKELTDIADDGQITEDEDDRLDGILQKLDDLATVISELKLIGQKHLYNRK